MFFFLLTLSVADNKASALLIYCTYINLLFGSEETAIFFIELFLNTKQVWQSYSRQKTDLFKQEEPAFYGKTAFLGLLYSLEQISI